jgi:hypothetical protein
MDGFWVKARRKQIGDRVDMAITCRGTIRIPDHGYLGQTDPAGFSNAISKVVPH